MRWVNDWCSLPWRLKEESGKVKIKVVWCRWSSQSRRIRPDRSSHSPHDAGVSDTTSWDDVRWFFLAKLQEKILESLLCNLYDDLPRFDKIWASVAIFCLVVFFFILTVELCKCETKFRKTKLTLRKSSKMPIDWDIICFNRCCPLRGDRSQRLTEILFY